jgi:DNA modification methylase
MIDLRLGDYRDVLADVECDAVITDPPYGERVHKGHDSAVDQVKATTGQTLKSSLSYSCWAPDDVSNFVDFWAQRCRGWIVAMTSHDLIPAWEQAYLDAGRFAFAPVPYINMVSRPRKKEFMGGWSCSGAYIPGEKLEHEKKQEHIGGKPLWLMREIVRDYARPGHTVCDPCAGGGTTLIAAAIEGCKAVGAEIDPATHKKARARVSKGHTPDMFALFSG